MEIYDKVNHQTGFVMITKVELGDIAQVFHNSENRDLSSLTATITFSVVAVADN